MEKTCNIVKASDVIGVGVKNLENENLGKIEEVMLDKETGDVRYVVLSFSEFLGLGGKLFALPWRAISYDTNLECFILNRKKETLKNAPGFDKDHWPDMASPSWSAEINRYYE